MTNTCTHTRKKWQDHGYEDWGGSRVEDSRMVEVSTTQDVDTHRYQCTQCKQMMYYSSRAQDFYEKGIKCHIPGLDK